jgi:adenylosuccinate synthase
LRDLLDYHNFLLERRHGEPPVDLRRVLETCLAQGERICRIVGDVTGELHALRARGANVLFEGAQGTMLDIDHGTFPFVTSSNTVAGYAPVGTGLGPRDIDDVLGIVKAYTTRVGAGPFPTELADGTGRHLSEVGQEFGAVTGRPRRTGWFDAVALRRSIVNNGITGLCVTKLDVLDGLAEVKYCSAYGEDGAPRYETMPGWTGRTAGLRALDALPAAARAYLSRLEEACGVPVTMISTGPERDEMIVSRHPFG